MNTGYLRRLKGASDPDCASTGQSWRSARPVRPVTLSPWQVLEGVQCGWRREGWRAGRSLQETLVVAAGAAGCWVRPGVCLGCGPHAGRPGRGLRASWGSGRTRVWAVSPGDHTSWAWSSQGCVWGSIRPAALLPGPDEALVHKRPRLAKMLCPPRLPGAERETRRGHERRQTV